MTQYSSFDIPNSSDPFDEIPPEYYHSPSPVKSKISLVIPFESAEAIALAAYNVNYEKGDIELLTASLEPCPLTMIHEALDIVIHYNECEAASSLSCALLSLDKPVLARHIEKGIHLLQLETALLWIQHSEGNVMEAFIVAENTYAIPRHIRIPIIFFVINWWKQQANDTALPQKISALFLKEMRSLKSADIFTQIALISTPQLVADSLLISCIKEYYDQETLDLLQQIPFIPLLELYEGMTIEEHWKFLMPQPFPKKTEKPKKSKKQKNTPKNAQCPCGSGLKHKNCCMKTTKNTLCEETLRKKWSSPRQGEILKITREKEIFHKNIKLLATIDPTNIDDKLKEIWFESLISAGYIPTVLEYFENNHSEKEKDLWLACVYQFTLHAHSKHILELIHRFPGGEEIIRSESDESIQLYLLKQNATSTIADLDSFFMKLIKKENHQPAALSECIHTLLKIFPALGILAARGELFREEYEPQCLWNALLEVRDENLLPKKEPVEDRYNSLLDQIDNEMDQSLLEMKLSDAQEMLSKKETSIKSLKSDLISIESEKSALEKSLVREEISEESSSQISEYKKKISNLKEEIKTEHRKGNLLKKELENKKQSEEAKNKPEKNPVQALLPKEELITQESLGAQPVRLPLLSERFERNLKNFPKQVQSKALQMLGLLCSGSSKAFSNSKKLIVSNEAWRVRIGLSYRLLYRKTDEHIIIEDIIHRKDLDSVSAKM